MPLARDPLQAVLNFWIPAVVLSTFVGASTLVSEINDVIGSTSIAVLAYVELYQQIRATIPRIPAVTTAEIVILLNLLYSLFPLIL